MRRVASILALLVLTFGLIAGCGCLAADSYEKPECQKYRTNWDFDSIYHEE